MSDFFARQGNFSKAILLLARKFAAGTVFSPMETGSKLIQIRSMVLVFSPWSRSVDCMQALIILQSVVSQLELSQIRYFILTAQLQNMSKAAQRLNLTQPSLSKSISNLENELGTELFDRFGKRLVLNERGQLFLDTALALLSGLEDSVNAITEKQLWPKVNLGIFRRCECIFDCIEAFHKVFPDYGFNVFHYETVSEHLDTDVYDTLIYPKENAFKKYRGYHLLSDPFLLAVCETNPLSERSEILLNELQNENFVILRFYERSFETAYKLCLSSGVSLRIFCYADSIDVHREMISHGLGIGFIPSAASLSYKNDARIRLLPISDKDFSQEIMIGFKREKHLSDAGRAFRDFASDFFRLTH